MSQELDDFTNHFESLSISDRQSIQRHLDIGYGNDSNISCLDVAAILCIFHFKSSLEATNSK